MQGPEASLLALATATAAGGIALLRGEAVIAAGALPEAVPTSESLLPAIDALLAETGTGLAELAGYAISIGPGSFTGLRVGVATVKGLAFGSSQPVAAVPSLAALALSAPPGEGPVVALLDARRGEVYAAGYAAPGQLEPGVLAEGLYDAGAIAARLPAKCRLVGEGVAVCGAALRAALGSGVTLVTDVVSPRAADVGRLGAGMLARGEALPAAELAPRYVRRAEAEVRRTGHATEA